MTDLSKGLLLQPNKFQGNEREQSHGKVIPRPDGQQANCPGPPYCWTCHLEDLVYTKSADRVVITEGLVMKPGSKVLLISGRPIRPEQAEQVRLILKQKFPEVDITIVDGFIGVQYHD